MLYLEDGYIDKLWNKYFAFDGCSGRQVPAQSDLQFGISHTLGLFVLLAVAILVSSIIMIGERLFFKHILPKIRAKPPNTFWKSETILFISQVNTNVFVSSFRLYKTLGVCIYVGTWKRVNGLKLNLSISPDRNIN